MGTGDKLFFGAITLLIGISMIFIALIIGYEIYADIFISTTITTTVISKEINVSHRLICQIEGETSICTPTTFTSYNIFTNEKQFSTSSNIFYRIVIGKKYVFRVVGWDCCQSISGILEEGK